MAKTALLAKMTAQPGKRAELVEAMMPLVEAVRQEPGTELYVMHESSSEPDVVWFYELYTDQDALKAHASSETMKEAGGRLAGLLAGRPELIPLTPKEASGIDL